jgi:hypothetical protein
MIVKKISRLAGVLAALTLSVAASLPLHAEELNVATAASNWTPVIVNTCFAPRPFKGSEQQWHLVYDVTLTNYSHQPSTVQKFEISGKDAAGNWKVLQTLDADALKKIILTLSQNEPTCVLPPGAVSALFINLDFADKKDVPVALKHRIVFESLNPLKEKRIYDYTVAKTIVEDKPAVRISPPLRGGKWVAAGGFVGVAGHRQALFPIDNGLHSAQPFAIDWVRIDETGHSSHDPKKVTGYACYGEPVVAVADGKIFGVVNKFVDQTPPEATGSDRFKWAGGNYIVQDIGNGYYAFYAHMKPGSITVKEGDTVHRGQQIGAVGNTGNTTGPHLHMHITRNPGMLQADGVPYAFDNFDVLGQFKNFDTAIEADMNGTEQHYVDGDFKGPHHDELIREGFVVDFGGEHKAAK